jgi:hypothetical protein
MKIKKQAYGAKIVFKTGVEHTKNNMRRITYIYTMLRVLLLLLLKIFKR